MNVGWIKLHRKIQDWGWYNEPNTFKIFMHLLIHASVKKSSHKGHDIDVGQLVVGRKILAEKNGLSEQQVRTSLDKLVSSGEISIKSTNRFSIVTIVNWGDYQGSSVEDNQQITNNQPQYKNIQYKNKEEESGEAQSESFFPTKNEESADEPKTEELMAFDFIKKHIPSQVQTFEYQNKKQLGDDWDRMIENYNDTVLQEQLTFIPQVLLARLRKYCRSWIHNKNSKPQRPKDSGDPTANLAF